MDEVRSSHHEFPILGRAYFLGGRASTSIKRILQQAGVDEATARRVGVACYEAEMNIVLHAQAGHISLDIYPTRVEVAILDHGPGIADIELAMTPGWSSAPDEARALGFGAGMGLANIKNQADDMKIESDQGEGVRVLLAFRRGGTKND